MINETQLQDLSHKKQPPATRRGKADGGLEEHLYEAAVMLAFALYLFRTDENVRRVEIHPDGEHGKQFPIRSWLEGNGFEKTKCIGSTSYGGVYVNKKWEIEVNPKSGLGDVVAHSGNRKIVAECKGGILNTRHAGQLSKLRRGLCEAVGLLMTREPDNEIHFAIVPDTSETCRLGNRLVERCQSIGIRIGLVDRLGQIRFL